MAGFITQEHSEAVAEVYGQAVADKMQESNAATFLEFLTAEGLI